ncbi:probable arginine--tRNA ligase, mitochondrial [Macrosteles quadrilineatus]|uniref:probable arginine--tRNA ligase, mitochondrial n=1 Tax=Macrosteles quadrilineatus TaxID=74068 RepID=UPI0023E314FE|nr:probable arginine--tRNA ligase, mitochondrial [Macrosteles quadrilineatus]
MNTSWSYKLRVSTKILDSVTSPKNVTPTAVSKILLYGSNQLNGQIHLRLPFKSYRKLFPDSSKDDFHNLLKVTNDNYITGAEPSNNSNEDNIIFNLHQNTFVEDVLLNKSIDTSKIGLPQEKIVIDYSSPNIAKPFHIGHLRSTIIGNFLANLYEHLGCKVTRINYLGDWGTQFGVLQVGLQQLNISNADLKKDPIKQLYEAYVTGSRQLESDNTAGPFARKVFHQLEFQQDSVMMDRWKMIKTATVEDLSKTYRRLGVKFDEYHWESMYNAKAFTPIREVMEANSLLEEDEDGKKVIELADGRKVPLVKSDGTTLYLTRDVTAALDRWVTFGFDKMLYVVDNSQNQHFSALKQVLKKLDYDWADNVEHVKFGRVKGMSSRKGQVIFLEDILDEAKLRMVEKQRQSPTTKNSSEEVSDVLGVSAIIVNDLKQRRMKDYSFDWDSALQMDGDSGVKLQYSHCRLCSLELNCGVSLPDRCDSSVLSEPQVQELVLEIARFEEAVERAHSKLEAYEIVTYLFKLCNKTSQALKTLNVKHQPAAVAEQRLLLFSRVRTTLNCGMKLLGLRPLTEM